MFFLGAMSEVVEGVIIGQGSVSIYGALYWTIYKNC